MFYLLKDKPDSSDMEARGSDTVCVPQAHRLKSGETLWLVSGDLDTTDLNIEYQFASAEQWLFWQATYCEAEYLD